MKDRHILWSQTSLVTLCIRYEQQHSSWGSACYPHFPHDPGRGEEVRVGGELQHVCSLALHIMPLIIIIAKSQKHTCSQLETQKVMDDRSQLSACPELDCGLGWV